ncbi:MAG: peroxiredoxin-like family protein [Candidatus Dormibacteria bacterium]|nr:AhpC/TSA family protein [Frankia sp.]
MDARALSSATVLDVDGESRPLGELWSDGPAVVVWLRHFGCIYCREQAQEYTAHAPALRSAGVRLAFVGNGTPRAARWFRDRYAPTATVVTDPALQTYKLIGARSGLFSTLGPQTWGSAIRALRRGARQGMVRGRPFQQGGTLVVTPDDRVLYRHISAAAGDHPDAAGVVEAACNASTGADRVALATGG